MIKRSFVPFHFTFIIKQSVFRTAGLVDFNDHDLRFQVYLMQVPLKDDQAISHLIKSLSDQPPIMIIDPVPGKRVHPFG